MKKFMEFFVLWALVFIVTLSNLPDFILWYRKLKRESKSSTVEWEK